MELINKVITFKKKKFPIRIHNANNPEYIFITHHGLLSNKTSWRYFEKWLGDKGTIISYDARLNGENTMRASRLKGTYTRDLRDMVRWTKAEYPNKKIVTVGSSWGACIVIDHAKKYGSEVFKSIAWSIPYNFTAGDDANEIKEKVQEVKKDQGKIMETTKLGYAWRFAAMLFLNINAKSYTKIDLTKTADNKILARLNKMNKPKPTPVKLFWATYKSISSSNSLMIKINKRNEESELLYFQSTVDSYLKPKKLAQLKKYLGKGVTLKILNEGKHAFQWETENDLNIRVFEMMIKWLKTRD